MNTKQIQAEVDRLRAITDKFSYSGLSRVGVDAQSRSLARLLAARAALKWVLGHQQDPITLNKLLIEVHTSEERIFICPNCSQVLTGESAPCPVCAESPEAA